MAFVRDKTRPQGDRPIFKEQKNFGGGLNVDIPASDINKNELSKSENLIAHERYMEGRSGSVKINKSMPSSPSGDLHSVKWHDESLVEVFHWGAKLYNGSTELTSYLATQASGDFTGADKITITASETGTAQNAYTVIVTDTVSAGAETITWSATSVTIACEAGVSTITQVLAGSVTGTAWATLADASGAPGATTISAMSSTAMSSLANKTSGVDGFFTIDSASTLKPYGKDFLLFTASGIFMILVGEGQNKFFQVNKNQGITLAAYSSPGGDYRYRYIATWSTILDSSGDPNNTGTANNNNRNTSGNNLIWEAPSVFNKTRPDLKNYLDVYVASAIDTGAEVTLDISNLITAASSLAPQTTHITIYRTEDLGVNGLDDLYNSQYVWITDIPIANTTYDDETEDDVVQTRKVAGSYLNDTQGWEAIPSGDVGEVTDAFLFVATRGNDTLYYNQLEDSEHIGFYSAAFQYKKLEDIINVLASTPDILTIACSGSTSIASLNSWSNPLGDDGLAIDFIASLNHFTVIDRKIGVKDYGSFSEVEQGTYIAVCSDKSVRTWDGAGWSEDYSKDKVNSIIKKIVEGISVGIYYKGAYLLWYTDDLTVTPANATPTKCLRLSTKKESGKGWTQYTGSDWPLPPVATGAYIASNKVSSSVNGDDMLYVIDVTDEFRYWIETFDGAANNYTSNNTSSLLVKKYYGDKMTDDDGAAIGTEVIPKFKGKEATGARESFNIKHSESHIYMRDVTTQLTRATLAIDALAYVDSSSTPTETAGRISAGHDIQFWRRVEGSRIAIEYNFNRSGIIVTGTDTRYRVQDIKRPSKSPVQAVAGTFQTQWASNLKHWLFSRPTALLDRVTGTKFTSNGVTTTTAPDSRSNGIQVSGASTSTPLTVFEVSESPTSLFETYGDFTINFWCKDPVYTGGTCSILNMARVDYDNFTVSFLDTDKIRIHFESNIDIAIDAIDDGEWHHFVLVRSGSTTTVYQNDVSKGTVTYGTEIDTYKIIIPYYIAPS